MNVIEEMKLLSEDHTHDGWPAVKMSEITQLIEIIEKQAERIAELESYNVRLANESHDYQQRCAELEQWVAGIADSHDAIPDWIQQSARSLLAKGGER